MAAPRGTLSHLRQVLATLDRDKGFCLDPGFCPDPAAARLPLGLPALDQALGGGLAAAALHEVAAAGPEQVGAALGFCLAIAARRTVQGNPHVRTHGTAHGGAALFIQTEFAALESGMSYGPGLHGFGLPTERLVLVRVPRPLDALWACEEALKSAGVAIVIAELPERGDAADFTATRRLMLAAQAGGGLGLLLRHRPLPGTTAAMTRWQVAAAPSVPDRFGGLGRTAFDLSMDRNRRGRCGRFVVCWDHHACAFLPQTLSVGVAAAADDGSPDPRPLAHIG